MKYYSIAPWILLIKRDLKGSFTSGRCGQAVAFQAAAVVIFSLALGHQPILLEKAAPGLLWALSILVQIFTYDGLFHDDQERGMNSLFIISKLSLYSVVLCKALAHIVTISLPLVFLVPLWSVLLGFDGALMLYVCSALLLAIPSLTGMGMIVGSLLCHVKKPMLLTSMLLLPLTTPIVIAGTFAIYTLSIFPMFVLLLLSLGFGSLGVIIAAWALYHQSSHIYDDDGEDIEDDR